MIGALFGYGRAGKIHFRNIIDSSNITLHYIYETKERVREVSKEIHDITYKGPKLDKKIKARIEHVCQLVEMANMESGNR